MAECPGEFVDVGGTESERRAIRQILLDIANQNKDVALCNQAALEGAMMFDRMEDDDARRQSR